MYDIYLVTNLANGKQYVGQTFQDLKDRWLQHTSEANRGSNFHFHNAIRKYGPDSFSKEIIETVETRKQANDREKHYISHFDTFNNGYNGTTGGEGSATLALDNQALKEMYESGKSTIEIAKITGANCVTIWKRLIASGTDIRSRAPAKRYSNEHIKGLYLSGKSTFTIADELGMAPSSINRRLKELGVPMRTSQDYRPVATEEIIGLYREGRSAYWISKHLGIKSDTVRRCLWKAGETIRSASEAQTLRRKKAPTDSGAAVETK